MFSFKNYKVNSNLSKIIKKYNGLRPKHTGSNYIKK